MDKGDQSRKQRQGKAKGKSDPADMPAEGPHARDDLTDREKTPGTGSLPDRNSQSTDAGPD
ncbi:MAG: hypothetical protein QHC90_14735 [Shinella sp.]|nr:hypothetical protein [Shinella sp.]